ncbi:flavodoxin family protein [Pseudooceanicola marinus]|uniref:flavodoxin family protein n=1 Tax=Pseudooceanicola marinus TaxID=396013 RepID=UPI001CD7D371|nr:flavodoxin family protein [Pseudooceanicola marinus]MCA1337714.1 flavodoxin family protein [Pseudooceanicola marinus]
MAVLAVVYWSGSTSITLAARAVAGGAAAAGVEVHMVDVLHPKDIDWPLLARADGIVLGAPTYMGGVAAGMKAFMDETGHAIWTERLWKDKLAGGFTCGIQQAGDKLATLKSMAVFAAQHGMIWIGQEVIGAPVMPENAGLNASGTFLGLAVGSATDGQLDPGDAASARLFGERLAGALARWC